MKILIYLFVITISLSSCQSQTKNQAKSESSKTTYNVEKTENEWREALTPQQYHVLREAGTERPFTSEYNKNPEKGTYSCAGCKNPLYESVNKFDSGTGWPSFDRAIEGSILTGVDFKLGYSRNELKCGNCGGHLGHVFGDGPRETTGQRHCINGVALNFSKDNEKI